MANTCNPRPIVFGRVRKRIKKRDGELQVVFKVIRHKGCVDFIRNS